MSHEFRTHRKPDSSTEAVAQPAMSAAQWYRAIEQSRHHVTSEQRAEARTDIELVRQRFEHWAARSRVVLADPRMKQPGFAILRQLAMRAVSLAKPIYAELQRFDADRGTISSFDLMSEGLESLNAVTERVAGQLWLLDSTDGHAEALHEAIDELLYCRTIAGARFQNLARRIADEVFRSANPQEFLLEPGFRLETLIPPRRSPADPEVYLDGIQVARFALWCAGRRSDWNKTLEGLTVAALFHHCGLLLMDEPVVDASRPVDPKRGRGYTNHPSLGAALAGGIRDLSVSMPLLIAGHHERLDGTGFPRGLRADQFDEATRLLQVVCRFQELLRQSSDETHAIDAAQRPIDSVAACLFREARRGELDLTLTHALFDAIDPSISPQQDGPAGADRRLVRQIPSPHLIRSRQTDTGFTSGTTAQWRHRRLSNRD